MESKVSSTHYVHLISQTDFAGWRKAARALAQNGVKPSEVIWTVRNQSASPEAPVDASLEVSHGTFNVPAKFVELTKIAILHRNPERFALLYRLLWRLRSHHDLLEIATDPDVVDVDAMAKAVHRDEHRMHALVRFREVGRENKAHYVAWFEPEHHIVELAAPFFARRFADMPWSILTSDVCAHWDGHAVAITPGVARSEAPSEDRLEEVWRSYCAGIFNPARLKVTAMQTEMPNKYWKNPPEAPLINPPIAEAERMANAMTTNVQNRVETSMPRTATSPSDSIAALRSEAADCRACPLWKDATQTVFGEGPSHAQMMLVGEQPGDKEDLAGKPFVGPAGQMLDRALEEAGIDRAKVYVTNAVKHFKFVPRGKIRLHQKPNTPEIRACRQWYERELAAIKPELVVAMGATAAQSVFGKVTPVNKSRGRLIEIDDGTRALVTVHPSYLLRLPDEDARAREYKRFVDDLKIAAKFLRKSAHAA